MALHPRQKQRIGIIIGFIVLSYAASKFDPESSSYDTQGKFEQAYSQQQSDVQLQLDGTVKTLLPDDNKGLRHQRFIIEVANGKTVLVAHNIDLAARIDSLRVGDFVSIYGEYEWNAKGGVIHWTHHDPKTRHIGGWIRHNGSQYQ